MIFNSIKFDNPYILFGFAVFILLFIFDIINRGKRKKLSEELEKKLLYSAVLFRLFLAFIIIALAGPRWGMGFAASDYRRGLDIVFAVDVSRSMDIRDIQTGRYVLSRLERGLFIARESVISVTGARFAAAIGRGRGYLAVPLTHDSEAAQVFLEALDGSSMTGRSTNLEALVEAAANAFVDISPARKVIVLISDGESHQGILRNAINRCVRDGIIVSTVAVGSDEGRQIPINSGEPENMVTSRRDASAMRAAAERTGGLYIDGNREDAASVLSSHLLSLAQETEISNARQEPKQRRTLFIMLALISYAVSKFVTRNFHAKRSVIVSIIAVTALFSSCSEGKLLLIEANYLFSRGRFEEAHVQYLKALNHEDAAPYAEYGIGLIFYSLDEVTSALQRYANSKSLLERYANNEHRELRFRNQYNSGIILFEEGDYTSAASAFREALRTDPRSMDAKRNLELSLMSITAENSSETSSGGMQEQREILFDYLRYEEDQRWRSREWAREEETYSGADY